MSALFLSRATESNDLYNQAKYYYSYYNVSKQNRVFNWDSKGPSLPILFAQVAQSSANISGNFSEWQSISEQYFDSIINGDSAGYMTKGLCIVIMSL